MRPPSSWPKVVGIICLVFGIIAAALGLLGAATSDVQIRMLEELGTPSDLFDRHMVAVKILPAVAGLLGLVAVIGSILLIMRRKAGWSILLLWAGLKIAYALGQAPFTAAMQKEIMPYQLKMLNQMQANSGKTAAPPVPLIEVATSMAQVFSVLWYCALPIFILIFFLRKKVRDEVDGWTNPTSDIGGTPPPLPPSY